jgi:hypothetical protein
MKMAARGGDAARLTGKGLLANEAKPRWRKRLGVEPSLPPKRQQPILKTGRATGPRSLPS